ncbi:MAG: hypothetical protein HYW81_02810, partial [Parcubacteria group bacterium]|nr:hypothetical protein [Parcubacteria group bacterium]
ALEAYVHRLPEEISVDWFRDGGFLVGRITAGDASFMTQARSADEFIEMVNDALFTVYEIPRAYADVLMRHKRFEPSSGQLARLEDASVPGARIGFSRPKLKRQLA